VILASSSLREKNLISCKIGLHEKNEKNKRIGSIFFIGFIMEKTFEIVQ
jgi:hypothetical protein